MVWLLLKSVGLRLRLRLVESCSAPWFKSGVLHLVMRDSKEWIVSEQISAEQAPYFIQGVSHTLVPLLKATVVRLVSMMACPEKFSFHLLHQLERGMEIKYGLACVGPTKTALRLVVLWWWLLVLRLSLVVLWWWLLVLRLLLVVLWRSFLRTVKIAQTTKGKHTRWNLQLAQSRERLLLELAL
jgi:hypothetical protein